MEKLVLLQRDEQKKRVAQVQECIAQCGADALVVSDSANLYYLCGRVFAGFAYVPREGEAMFFVRRPVEMEGDDMAYIRKPEDIPVILAERGVTYPAKLGLELDVSSYSLIERLKSVWINSKIENGSSWMRRARAVKTDEELRLLRISGEKQATTYRQIPKLFEPGMTDYELQVAIENVSRLEGNLGIFRICGPSMEFFMGNVIAGENADTPTPYDFAMGGRGMDPSLPGGASGDMIHRGESVMVDVNGNYTGYMTDMTRVYSYGEVSELAKKAHQCSIDIHEAFKTMALPGTEAKALYEMAMEMVKERGLERYFMGHRQHAGFIGHGVGIEINEFPVLAPRSRDVLCKHNVIALEPKFVIPGTGAVGIESTYVVTDNGAESITNAPVEIIPLEEH